jgi:hypothetical protein
MRGSLRAWCAMVCIGGEERTILVWQLVESPFWGLSLIR